MTDKPDRASHNTQPQPKKKSLYQRFVDAKTGRNVHISDEDMRKYTGMTRAELREWSQDRPGVAGNQPAGKLAMGPVSGLGGLATAEGYGGWGPGAGGKLKFPPRPPPPPGGTKGQEGKNVKDVGGEEEDDEKE